MFTEKVWKTNRFGTFEDIDRENDRFNEEGREFFLFRYKDLAYRYRSRRLTVSHRIQTQHLNTRRNKKVNFIRFVAPSIDEPRDHIMIMNQRIFVAEAYTHQFVFATWDLQDQQLQIVSEYQGTIKPVLRIPFKINE